MIYTKKEQEQKALALSREGKSLRFIESYFQARLEEWRAWSRMTVSRRLARYGSSRNLFDQRGAKPQKDRKQSIKPSPFNSGENFEMRRSQLQA